MSSKLRPLYDGLYMGFDTWLLGFNENRSGRKEAAKTPKNENFDREFKEIVLPYWKQFGVRPKKFWFRIFCAGEEHVDPRYIPYDIWFRKVVPHFNTLLFSQALQDKCLHNITVPNVKKPGTVVKNVAGLFYDDTLHLLTEEEAIRRCMSAGRCIVKKSVGSGMGRDIVFFNGCDMDESKVRALFTKYGGRNFIVQEKLAQHEVMAAICDRSVNTIRMITFLYKGEVHIMSAILRMGAGTNEVDNYTQGGYACRIGEDGRLNKYAVNGKAGWVTAHPGGTVFETVTIPNYEKLKQTVKTEAEKLGHFRIIGWDFAIGTDGEPVFIEYNVIPEMNQTTCGPSFGEMTDEVLAEVFGRKK